MSTQTKTLPVTLLCKCTQNQLTVQVYTKPVYCTSVNTTSLLYKFTQNQFTVVQVYTKPVYCISLHKTSLMVNNERNVHGQNINKECTWTEHYKGTSVTKSISLQLYTKPVYCTSLHKTSLLVNNERNVDGENNS